MKSLSTSGPIRIHRDSRGRCHVVADLPSSPFRGAFRVARASKDQVRVGLGTIEGQVPTLNGTALNARRVPLLKLTGGPDAELRSWVCLRYVVDPKSGKADPDNTAAATIVHLNDYTRLSSNGLVPDENGAGHLALALVLWRDPSTLQRIVQNVWFNQRHSFQPAPPKGGKAWHFFHPAA